MQRFWRWMLVTVLVLALSSLGWRWGKAGWAPSGGASQEGGVAVRQEAIWAAAQVQPDRLLADVAALSFPRFEEGDRQTAQRYITDALRAAGWEPQTQSFMAADGVTGTNVIARRLGTDPKAGTVLLGAHYDTVARSPGADDNASGVATVLEVARVLAQQDTPRTLELVLFDQEETGLWGSQAVAEAWQSIAAAEDYQVAVILDMIGYRCTEPQCQTYPNPMPIAPPSDRGDFLAVLADQPHPELANAFFAASEPSLPPVFALAVPLLGSLTPDLLRSDHAPFWDRRIGAALVTDTANFRNPHYHQPSDEPTTLDADFLTGSAQLVTHALLHLLFRPG